MQHRDGPTCDITAPTDSPSPALPPDKETQGQELAGIELMGPLCSAPSDDTRLLNKTADDSTITISPRQTVMMHIEAFPASSSPSPPSPEEAVTTLLGSMPTTPSTPTIKATRQLHRMSTSILSSSCSTSLVSWSSCTTRRSTASPRISAGFDDGGDGSNAVTQQDPDANNTSGIYRSSTLPPMDIDRHKFRRYGSSTGHTASSIVPRSNSSSSLCIAGTDDGVIMSMVVDSDDTSTVDSSQLLQWLPFNATARKPIVEDCNRDGACIALLGSGATDPFSLPLPPLNSIKVQRKAYTDERGKHLTAPLFQGPGALQLALTDEELLPRAMSHLGDDSSDDVSFCLPFLPAGLDLDMYMRLKARYQDKIDTINKAHAAQLASVLQKFEQKSSENGALRAQLAQTEAHLAQSLGELAALRQQREVKGGAAVQRAASVADRTSSASKALTSGQGKPGQVRGRIEALSVPRAGKGQVEMPDATVAVKAAVSRGKLPPRATGAGFSGGFAGAGHTATAQKKVISQRGFSTNSYNDMHNSRPSSSSSSSPSTPSTLTTPWTSRFTISLARATGSVGNSKGETAATAASHRQLQPPVVPAASRTAGRGYGSSRPSLDKRTGTCYAIATVTAVPNPKENIEGAAGRAQLPRRGLRQQQHRCGQRQ